MKNAMTVQKELFVQGLLAGKTRYEAYIFAYPEDRKKNKRTVENKASKMANRPEITARLEELRAGVQKETAVTLTEFVTELQKIALGPVNLRDLKIQDKLRALELLAKVLNLTNTGTSADIEDLTPLAEMLNEPDD
jgi:hypothetical protein